MDDRGRGVACRARSDATASASCMVSSASVPVGWTVSAALGSVGGGLAEDESEVDLTSDSLDDGSIAAVRERGICWTR